MLLSRSSISIARFRSLRDFSSLDAALLAVADEATLLVGDDASDERSVLVSLFGLIYSETRSGDVRLKNESIREASLLPKGVKRKSAGGEERGCCFKENPNGLRFFLSAHIPPLDTGTTADHLESTKQTERVDRSTMNK